MHIKLTDLPWSDLEIVVSVAQQGTVSAAARLLGINHTTVLRRIRKYEAQVGTAIFVRHQTGYQLTSAGEAFLEAGISIKRTVEALDRRLAATQTDIAGDVSITATDSLSPVLVEILASMQLALPTIKSHLLTTNSRLDLDRRDADIAVRASNDPPSHLVGRKACDLHFEVFASQDLAKQQNHLPIAKRSWLGLEAPISRSVANQWLERNVGSSNFKMASNSFLTLAQMAATGLGYAIIPAHCALAHPQLVKVDMREFSISDLPKVALWVLAHKDVRHAPRIKAATAFLYENLRQMKCFRPGR